VDGGGIVGGPVASGPATRSRKAWVAALLAALFPGFGHLYAGRPRAAWLLLSVPPLILLAGTAVPVAVDRGAVATVVGFNALDLLIWIGQIVWAVMVARAAGPKYVLRRCNRRGAYAWFVVASVCVGLLGGSAAELVYHGYRISSRSMAPTMLPGDRVLVTRLAPADRTPRRGDLIVYVYPADRSKDFVKRVVGMPGETIEIIDKVVYVNGKPYADPAAVHDDPHTLPASKFPRDNMAALRIPDSHYFVLGDNRDNSLDSRFHGPVPLSDVRGRVRVIYWSWADGHVRWGRIGLGV